MSYAVVWNPEATDRIDSAWRTSASARREQIFVSLQIVERQLASIPMEVGESRAAIYERVLIEPPLVVYFRVDDDASQVRVLGARVANTSS